MRTTTLLLALGIAGCAIDDRLALDVPIAAGGTGVATFAATDGGTVTLDEALVTFVDLRLEEPPSDDLESVARGLHPGHDYPGDVAGELLGTFTVDLLAPETELGAASCYEGAFATGRVSVVGTAAVMAGVHEDPDGAERAFRFEVTADEDVIGIPFDAHLVAGSPPERITLGIDPALALAFVDWSGPDADGDGVLTTADGTYDNTVRFGVVATPTWSLSLAR